VACCSGEELQSGGGYGGDIPQSKGRSRCEQQDADAQWASLYAHCGAHWCPSAGHQHRNALRQQDFQKRCRGRGVVMLESRRETSPCSAARMLEGAGNGASSCLRIIPRAHLGEGAVDAGALLQQLLDGLQAPLLGGCQQLPLVVLREDRLRARQRRCSQLDSRLRHRLSCPRWRSCVGGNDRAPHARNATVDIDCHATHHLLVGCCKSSCSVLATPRAR
jgi:hypothetical protein